MREKPFLTDRDLAARYDVARCTPWRWAKAGTFPKPIRISANISRWRRVDVEEHEAAQAARAA